MGDPVQDLVPILKEYLDISNSDREDTRKLIEKLETAIESFRECLVTMKIQLRELRVRAEDRDESCIKRHEVIDGKLEIIPSKEMMKKRDDDLDVMKKKFDDLLPKIYTAIAVCTGVGGLVGVALALAFQKFGGTGG